MAIQLALSEMEFMGKHHTHYLGRDRCPLYRLIGLKTNQFGLFRKHDKQKFPSSFEYVSKGHTEV